VYAIELESGTYNGQFDHAGQRCRTHMSTIRFYKRGATLVDALNEASCLGAMDRKPIACMKVDILKLTSIPTHPHTTSDLKLFSDGRRTQSAETVSIDKQNMHVD
jgi:hypothetical protein